MAELDPDSEKTRVIRRPARGPSATPVPEKKVSPPPSDETELTRLIGPPRRVSRPPTATETPPSESSAAEDPVIAWLVIVDGPGRGNFCRLGYGQNSIGRDAEERVRIDFGDDAVSRKAHCFVIYEPRTRQYTLRPGDGANLTYLNGIMISESRPIQSGDLIELGHTTLRLVPLCGPDFEWHEKIEGPRTR